METRTRVLVSFAVLIFLIGGLYIFTDWFSKSTGYVLGEDEKVKFVSCLSDKGTMLYTKENCVECFRQEEILGTKAFEIIAKTDCDKDNCNNLRELPAWEINGKLYYGKMDFPELSEISECPLR